jgi:hypothetical protein
VIESGMKMKYVIERVNNMKHGKASSFMDGIASTTDLLGTRFLKQSDAVLSRTDTDALRGDWQAVGIHLHEALEKNVKENTPVSPGK